MFESGVDGLGWAVAGAGVVEVGQDVAGSSLQGAAEASQFDQRRGNSVVEISNRGAHDRSPDVFVWVTAGSDDALVDTPGGFDLNMRVTAESRTQPMVLTLGE